MTRCAFSGKNQEKSEVKNHKPDKTKENMEKIPKNKGKIKNEKEKSKDKKEKEQFDKGNSRKEENYNDLEYNTLNIEKSEVIPEILNEIEVPPPIEPELFQDDLGFDLGSVNVPEITSYFDGRKEFIQEYTKILNEFNNVLSHIISPLANHPSNSSYYRQYQQICHEIEEREALNNFLDQPFHQQIRERFPDVSDT